MFSPKVIGSDSFLDMPTSSRELYFQLWMYADDDGFVNPKKIMRMVQASDDDLKMLVAKDFAIPFKSGVVVITDWKLNNLMRKDWYQETIYKEEKMALLNDENNRYILGNENVPSSATIRQHSLGKVSIIDTSKVDIEKEDTPSQITKDFLSKGKYYQEYLDLFGSKNNREAVEKEFDKFILYWTESNGSGTKKRWQQQPTFEVKRRLVTWLGKNNNFNRPIKQRIVL